MFLKDLAIEFILAMFFGLMVGLLFPEHVLLKSKELKNSTQKDKRVNLQS